MDKTILLLFLFFTTTLNSQQNMSVNANTLNIRENAGTEYEIIGKIQKNDIVTTLSEEGDWSYIETEDGLNGYVASKYLSIYKDPDKKTEYKKEKKEKSNNFWAYVIVGFLVISSILGGKSAKSKSSSSSKSSKKQNISNTSRRSVVYRFRIKGSGSAGSIEYSDGMNVEVAVKGPGASGSPFNTTVKDLFIKEFARKYNYNSSNYSAISMLFKQDLVDVEII